MVLKPIILLHGIKSDTRLYWELNEIVDRTENAYQPVTHMIFEILNPEKSYDGMTFSFTDQMMSKYGQDQEKCTEQ